MAKLTANTLVVKPGEVDPVLLSAGDDLPDWAEGLVGDHLLEDDKPKRATSSASRGKSEKSDS